MDKDIYELHKNSNYLLLNVKFEIVELPIKYLKRSNIYLSDNELMLGR